MPFFHQNDERILVYVNNDSGSETLIQFYVSCSLLAKLSSVQFIQGDLRGILKQERVKRNMSAWLQLKSSHPIVTSNPNGVTELCRRIRKRTELN